MKNTRFSFCGRRSTWKNLDSSSSTMSLHRGPVACPPPVCGAGGNVDWMQSVAAENNLSETACDQLAVGIRRHTLYCITGANFGKSMCSDKKFFRCGAANHYSVQIFSMYDWSSTIISRFIDNVPIFQNCRKPQKIRNIRSIQNMNYFRKLVSPGSVSYVLLIFRVVLRECATIRSCADLDGASRSARTT